MATISETQASHKKKKSFEDEVAMVGPSQAIRNPNFRVVKYCARLFQNNKEDQVPFMYIGEICLREAKRKEPRAEWHPMAKVIHYCCRIGRGADLSFSFPSRTSLFSSFPFPRLFPMLAQPVRLPRTNQEMAERRKSILAGNPWYRCSNTLSRA